MSSNQLNILIVGQETADFMLINSYLQKAFNQPVVVYCPVLEKATPITASALFDVLIISKNDEQNFAEKQLIRFIEKESQLAVIILSDNNNRHFAAEAIQAGAQDCLAKENLSSQTLYKSITYALARRTKNLQTAANFQQYKNIFDRNPIPLIVYQINNQKIKLVNEAAEKFYGFSAEEFKLMSASNLLRKKENGLFCGVQKHQHKNKETLQVEVLTKLVKLNGKTCRLATVIDLSKNKSPFLVTDEMQQQFVLLQSAIQNAADGIIITKNISGDFCTSEIVYSNAAFHNLTGYTSAKITGQKPELLHKKHPVKEASNYNEPQQETFETRLINYKNNKIDYWVDYSISAINDNQGKTTHFVAVYRDVSTRKNSIAENENLIKELQQSNDELKQFAYVISHNLRAPLASLTGLLSLLDTETIDDLETLEVIEAIRTSVNNLSVTVNDMIDILLIKLQNEPVSESLNVAETWNKVKTSLSYLIEYANAQIEADFTEAPTIFFTETYLESTLQNLLSNALKYRSDERQLVINIKTYPENGNTILIFEDNGIGIDLNKHGKQVFGLYKRFTSKAEGKGLGLYIVHTQITAQGGKIEVKSELNKGTRFTLTFKNNK